MPKEDIIDTELVDTLHSLGVNKREAKVMVYLANQDLNETVCSLDIQNATDLKQPEVSIIVKKLKEKNWVEENSLSKSGRGRSRINYKTLYTLQELFDWIKEEKDDLIIDIRNHLERMQELIKERREIGG
jgi:predicted transcriptional regulator